MWDCIARWLEETQIFAFRWVVLSKSLRGLK